MRRESPFPTQKRKANESHKQSIGQQPNRETVPNSEAYPKDADYLYLRPLEGAQAPHCLVLEAGTGGYVTPTNTFQACLFGVPSLTVCAHASFTFPAQDTPLGYIQYSYRPLIHATFLHHSALIHLC